MNLGIASFKCDVSQVEENAVDILKNELNELPEEFEADVEEDAFPVEFDDTDVRDDKNDSTDAEEQNTTEEKVALQEKEIQKVESGEKTLDSTQEKGNYGEMKMDQDLRSKGYERISKEMVTDTDSPGHQGIDGVYYNPDGNPKYIIADAKYGTAQLSETQDGKQMSDNWIDKRLDESVGKEKADDIRMEALINPDSVGKYVAHVDSDGNVTYDKLDSNANVVEKDVKINA